MILVIEGSSYPLEILTVTQSAQTVPVLYTLPVLSELYPRNGRNRRHKSDKTGSTPWMDTLWADCAVNGADDR